MMAQRSELPKVRGLALLCPQCFRSMVRPEKGFVCFPATMPGIWAVMRQQRKKDKKSVSERDLSVHGRALFQAPKRKELQSCRAFLSTMWGLFDTTENAIPERTLSARRLLTWSKNPDGSPRAKCHLIVPDSAGLNDLDVLQGNLDTSSPTTSRLSRNFLLSLTSTMQRLLWTSDISTTFLQGLPQERKLWIKLPAECFQLLGCGPETRMLLEKPCYIRASNQEGGTSRRVAVSVDLG